MLQSQHGGPGEKDTYSSNEEQTEESRILTQRKIITERKHYHFVHKEGNKQC